MTRLLGAAQDAVSLENLQWNIISGNIQLNGAIILRDSFQLGH